MDQLAQKRRSLYRPHPKWKKIQKYIYQIISFQKHFILSKHQMFWLSCDFFPFCVMFLAKKKRSLPANAAVQSKLYKACQCNVVQKTPDKIAHEKLYAMLSQRLQTTWHTKNPGNAVWTTSGVSIYIYYILGLSHQKNCHYLID